MTQIDLDTVSIALQQEIRQKEDLFDFGMRNNKEFAEMKKLHLEIKELKKQLKMLPGINSLSQTTERSVAE